MLPGSPISNLVDRPDVNAVLGGKLRRSQTAYIATNRKHLRLVEAGMRKVCSALCRGVGAAG